MLVAFPIAFGVGCWALDTHGSQFDVKTGEVVAGPAAERIAMYFVEESDEQVKLVVPKS